jgi:DNA-binding CsgD family transcriptional regulator
LLAVTTHQGVESLLSIDLLRGSSLMSSVVAHDGEVLHISPNFLRHLHGPRASVDAAKGQNLANVIGGNFGQERVRIIQSTIESGQMTTCRSVFRGVQHLSHFHPATDAQGTTRKYVVAIHEVTEGAVDRSMFAGNYVESEHNDFDRLAQLSPREVEVAICLHNGLDAKEIAETMHRSLETINSHKKSIFTKLGCVTQCEVAMVVRQAGLTERDIPRINRR